jgi:hypothetical protein
MLNVLVCFLVGMLRFGSVSASINHDTAFILEQTNIFNYAYSGDFSSAPVDLEAYDLTANLPIDDIGFASMYNLLSSSQIATNEVANRVVPLPAAAWLFGSALIGFTIFSSRRSV